MKNIALRLRYDGSAYHGWQVQKTLPTVAETLETALGRVCGGSVKLTGCGRTDAGVHALRLLRQFPHGQPHPPGPAAFGGKRPAPRRHCRGGRVRGGAGFQRRSLL